MTPLDKQNVWINQRANWLFLKYLLVRHVYISILCLNLTLIEAHLGVAFAQWSCIRANTVITMMLDLCDLFYWILILILIRYIHWIMIILTVIIWTPWTIDTYIQTSLWNPCYISLFVLRNLYHSILCEKYLIYIMIYESNPTLYIDLLLLSAKKK